MELIQISGYFVTYQRQGNDRNGNPVYLVNVFSNYNGTGEHWYNVNYSDKQKHGRRLDKYGNIRIQSYNIEQSIKDIISTL